MRIAYFVSSFPALSETFVLNQVTGLLDRGHDVHVFSRLRPEHAATHPDVDRYRLLARTTYRPAMPDSQLWRAVKAAGLFATHGWRNPRTLLRTRDSRRFGRLASSHELLYWAVPMLRSEPYDAVHCHFGPNGMHAAALRAVGALRGKLVTTFHAYGLTTYVRKWGDRVYEHLFGAGDLFLAISDYARDRLIELGCPADKIRIHHMGVDCRRFTPRPEPQVGASPVRLFSIGRLVEKKGFEFGVRAVADLKRRGLPCDYQIVGDGPLRSDLEALARTLDVADRVHLLGSRTQDQVATLLRDTDIFIAPSVTARDGDAEGIPVVLMEAMATGLPVISTRHAGISELVSDGVSGFLTNEREVDDLADRCAELVSDARRRHAMGIAGRERIERHFNIDTLNDGLVDTFQRLIAHGPD